MGIVYCMSCEGKVSEVLETCPHCGHPINLPTNQPSPNQKKKPILLDDDIKPGPYCAALNGETAVEYCKHCKEQVVISRKQTNHILHLLLTIFTAGMWLLVWLLCASKFGSWKCSQCGRGINRSIL